MMEVYLSSPLHLHGVVLKYTFTFYSFTKLHNGLNGVTFQREELFTTTGVRA
jgi:hypothetical protein